jgi:hypothetical protein
LTLEHRQPFSLGGPPTVENLCLLCRAHNAHTARNVFGDEFIARRITAREARTATINDVARSDPPAVHGGARGARARTSDTVGRSPTDSDAFVKVRYALIQMGFPPRTVASTLSRLHRDYHGLEVEPLLRAALKLLTPPPS